MKRIRLTENQLYGLIEQTLNELDWKTLYNASDKAHQRGEQDRMYKFGDAARDAFQKKYNTRRRGTSLEKGGTLNDTDPISTQTDIGYSLNKSTNEYEPHVTSRIQSHDKGEWNKWRDTAKKEEEKYGYIKSSPKLNKSRYAVSGKDMGDTDLERPEFNDVNNFLQGRSKYTKGKGWNESLTRRVTESVIRKLNESDRRWLTDPHSVVLNSVDELEAFVQENLDYDKCTMLEFNKSIRFSVDNGVRVQIENEYGEKYWQSISEVSSYDYYEEIENHSKDGKYYLTNYEWHKGI